MAIATTRTKHTAVSECTMAITAARTELAAVCRVTKSGKAGGIGS